MPRAARLRSPLYTNTRSGPDRVLPVLVLVLVLIVGAAARYLGDDRRAPAAKETASFGGGSSSAVGGRRSLTVVSAGIVTTQWAAGRAGRSKSTPPPPPPPPYSPVRRPPTSRLRRAAGARPSERSSDPEWMTAVADHPQRRQRSGLRARSARGLSLGRAVAHLSARPMKVDFFQPAPTKSCSKQSTVYTNTRDAMYRCTCICCEKSRSLGRRRVLVAR